MTRAVANEKLCLYFYYKGTGWRGRGEKNLTLCHTPTYVTNWINLHMSTSISTCTSKPKAHFPKETAVCSHIPKQPPCHKPQPTAQQPERPLQGRKIWVKFCQKNNLRKSNLRNTMSCFQNLYQWYIISLHNKKYLSSEVQTPMLSMTAPFTDPELLCASVKKVGSKMLS